MPAMSGQRRSERWFEQGATALARALPTTSWDYMCPLCLVRFDLNATRSLEGAPPKLTFEDVPPKSVGGRPLVLTCLECNGRGGRGVDSHAPKRELLRQVFTGTLREPIKATIVTEAGDRVPVDFAHEGDITTLAVVPKASSEAARTNLAALFDRRVADVNADLKFRLEFKATEHHPRQVRVSWLRSAYLLAYGALGYRYILQPMLDCVRAQIQEPDATHIDVFSVESPTRQERRIGYILEPTEFRSLAVWFEHFTVFLPCDSDLYQRLTTLRKKSDPGVLTTLTFQGKDIGWPRRPIFELDSR